MDGKDDMKAKFYRKTTSAGIYEEFGVDLWRGSEFVAHIPAVDEASAHAMLQSINDNAV